MNRKTLTKLARVAVIGALSMTGSSALAAKVGYIDMGRAIEESAAGKKARESLKAEYEKRQKTLGKKDGDIKKMAEDLQKKRTALSEEAFSKKNIELQEEMSKFRATVAENQEELQKKEKDLLEPILAKIKKATEQVAKEKGFDMVLESRAQSIVFAAADANLTADVLKALEKEK